MQIQGQPSTHFQEAREAMPETSRDRRSETGFALILAILALMLLTFLGLTLATTTSTELTIATNYRWSIQSRYNAEAGIEAGKKVLQGLNWTQILPVARATYTASTTHTLPGDPPNGLPASTRNYLMGDCDVQGAGVGYGVVLDDGTNPPFEDVSIVPGLASPPALNGAFTLWIRRPATNTGAPGGLTFKDESADDTMILTAEGVAPYTGSQFAGGLGRINLARQVIEVSLRRLGSGTPCGGRGGQIGGGPEGNNVYGANACDDPKFDEAVRHTGATFEDGGSLDKK